jgi:hypothetical protein
VLCCAVLSCVVLSCVVMCCAVLLCVEYRWSGRRTEGSGCARRRGSSSTRRRGPSADTGRCSAEERRGEEGVISQSTSQTVRQSVQVHQSVSQSHAVSLLVIQTVSHNHKNSDELLCRQSSTCTHWSSRDSSMQAARQCAHTYRGFFTHSPSCAQRMHSSELRSARTEEVARMKKRVEVIVNLIISSCVLGVGYHSDRGYLGYSRSEEKGKE